MTIANPPAKALLTRLDDAARALIAAEGSRLSLPAGAHVFQPGRSAEAYLIVTKGSVRVQLTAQSGREILLYRVKAGESCVLTTSSLLDSEAYAADAYCDEAVEAIALPKPVFRRLLAESASFRDAVLAAYASRVTDLILTVEDTQFRPLDARLAELLLVRGGAGRLVGTHQTLANELGSAREVVSRALKRFEHKGLVRLRRGLIEIKSFPGLREIAGGTTGAA